MAEQSITSLTINSILIGVLLMGLLGSYVLLVNNEGHGDIFDEYPEIQAYNLNITETYGGDEFIEVANINSNISSEYNTEISQSGGDRSGNAIGINLQNMITLTWGTLGFLGYVLFGNIYTTILSGLVMSVIGYLSVAYLIKFIRNGL